MSESKLSDPHNFQQFVVESSEGWITKPRPLFWEWLFYSYNPLRKKLDYLGITGCLPYLEFKGSLLNQGSVKKLGLSNQNLISKSDYHSLGSVIAIYAFFGITDLHFENVKFGFDSDGKFKFFSVDIEDLFGDFSDAGPTALLPTVDVPRYFCGLSALLKNVKLGETLDIPAAVCDGYVSSLIVLQENESLLWSSVLELIGDQPVPIRMVTRKTISYLKYLESGTFPQLPESQFCDPELDQMARGDVPYFFRMPNSFEVFYWASPNHAVNVDKILRGQFKFVEARLVSEKKVLGRKYLNELHQRGALQVLRAFIENADLSKSGRYNSTEVLTKNGLIFLKTGNLELSCRPLAHRSIAK